MIHHIHGALQAISPRRAQGIIMPFGIVNAHGHFATPDTNFGLDLFPIKPFFHLHLLDGKLQRHGQIIDTKLTDQGLHASVEIDDFAYNFIQTNPAGYTCGTMPHLLAVTGNGRITQFVLGELSFGHQDELANPPGTTTAHLQAHYQQTLPDNTPIQRGVIIMPPETTPQTPTEQTPPTPTPPPDTPLETPANHPHFIATLDSIAESIHRLDARLQNIEEAPTRQLPPSAQDPEPEEPEPAPQIHVASKYDHRTLLGMLFEDDLKTSRAHEDKNFPYARDNEWWRATIGKIRRQLDAQPLQAKQRIGFDAQGEAIFNLPDNIISIEAYNELHQRTPHLHADEAMRSDYTSYGLELVPTLFATVMYHFFRSQSKVFSLFEVFTPTSYPTFSWPSITSGPTFRLVPELSDESQLSPDQSPIPSSKLGTANIDFTAGGIGARTIITEQLLKGSSANLLDAAAMEFILQTAADIDWVLLNGDETAAATNISHLADPTGTAWDKVLALDGLRHMTIITNTADSAAEATIAKTTPGVGRAKMGTRGIIGDDIENIAMISCPEACRKFDALDAYESIADVGASRATLLTGQVGAVKGVPLISSQEIELGDANGKYEATHAAGTVGQTVFVHRGVIKVALFQAPRPDSEYIKHARSHMLHTTVELDIQQMEVGGTACLYNHTV